MTSLATTSGSERRFRLGLMIFTAAIFVSAFLIFLIQPMVGKRVLPWFGGAPGVWAVCLAFYQTALFVGYTYAHLSIRFATPRIQFVLHTGLLLGATLVPGVLPSAESLPEDGGSPELRIMNLLIRHVALPFIALAATGPLVQSWFARRYPTRSPYPLYAISNFGSLMALVAYPLLIEPNLGLTETVGQWNRLFLLGAILTLTCSAISLRLLFADDDAGASTTSNNAPENEEAPRPEATPTNILLWLALAGGAVVMLNGLSNRLCLDIASVPFLWILPLGTYLVTLIVSFSSDSAYRRGPLFLLVLGLLVAATLRVLLADDIVETSSGLTVVFKSVISSIIYYVLLLYAVCSILHGELHRLRPAAHSLTLYYLCVSGGGALGGLLVGLVAPNLFDGYAEFGIGLACCLVLGAYAAAREQGGIKPTWRGAHPLVRVLAVLTAALASHEAWLSVVRNPDQIHQERNLFGVIRVFEKSVGEEKLRAMMHGTTMHGNQFVNPPLNRFATSYFGRASSLASVLQMRHPDRPQRVGTIGLGVGTIAAYARKGDTYRFYELDPGSISLASDDRYFTYLSGSRGDISVFEGDGRLLLENEQAKGVRQDFDRLLIDAFSGDGVPVHLVSVEAFRVYERALAKNGILCVNVTNRHLDLRPIIARVGKEVGLHHIQIQSGNVSAWQTHATSWVYLAKSRRVLNNVRRSSIAMLPQLGLPPEAHRYSTTSPSELERTPLWTDDYSDLWGALRKDGPKPPRGGI